MRKQLEGFYPLTVTLTVKAANMRKAKLIVHKTYQGKHKSEDSFEVVFLLMSHWPKRKPGIIKLIHLSQNSLCLAKGENREKVRSSRSLCNSEINCRLCIDDRQVKDSAPNR